MRDRTGLDSRHLFFIIFFLILTPGLVLTGCARDKRLQRITAEQAATIKSLSREIERLNEELDQVIRAREELVRAKDELESKLRRELGSGDLSVSLEERGLVVTVLNKVLFDSGKAELKASSLQTLGKVSNILEDKVGDHLIFIEGHTDNVPITHSGWKSNWELSTTRATEVLHHFVDSGGVAPERLAAVGYGEFHPVDSNESEEGREQNRRVEIVVSPKRMEK